MSRSGSLPGAPSVDLPLGRLFEAWAARQPERPAMRTPHAEVSYGELNRRANALASELARASKPAASVATLLDSETMQAEAFIAALKIGRRFVPIDPRFPVERARFVVDDSQSVVLMTDNRHVELARQLLLQSTTLLNLDDLGQRASGENPAGSLPLETHTWIVYTSGTTGAPKGVMKRRDWSRTSSHGHGRPRQSPPSGSTSPRLFPTI
jgi:acyl-CoA synthetase (AMP-forming)/AMP-acid ligase II